MCCVLFCLAKLLRFGWNVFSNARLIFSMGMLFLLIDARAARVRKVGKVGFVAKL